MSTAQPQGSSFDVAAVRADFPILSRRIGAGSLAYLDNAASSQKPVAVVEAIAQYYREHHANIHRGVHRLGEEATLAFENARARVAAFINAGDARECVFTQGATAAINLVAACWGGANLRTGDEILLTEMEHHANIVPWQQAAARAGARVVFAPLNADGSLNIEEFYRRLSSRTRLVAVAHASNVLGTVNPVREIVAAAHAAGARVLADGAQAIAHFPADVRELGADFYVFSSHKVFGPTGIGVLYGKAEVLEAIPPWQFGGDMVRTVDFEGATFRDIPERFEAGTPNIADAVGLGVALDYTRALHPGAAAHEAALLARATARLEAVPGLRIYGKAPGKVPVISFRMEGIHPLDIGTMLDADGIAVRTGHHCAMPLMKTLGVEGTVRASFAFYNTFEEADRLGDSLERIRRMF